MKKGKINTGFKNTLLCRAFAFISLFLLPFHSFSNSFLVSDTINLKELIIGATYSEKATPSTFDSISPANFIEGDLINVLQSSTNMVLRTNGLGAASTIGFRGFSSNHTEVLWNNLPISNPSLGLADFSLFSSSSFQSLSLSYGGDNKEPLGFGASLNIQSIKPKQNRAKISFAQSFASFKAFESSFEASISNNKQAFNVHYSNRYSKFSYPYLDPNSVDRNILYRPAVDLNSNLFGIDYYLSLKANSEFSFHLSYQAKNGSIQPSILVVNKEEWQQDLPFRIQSHYRRKFKDSRLSLSFSFANEKQRYKQDVLGLSVIDNVNSFKQFLGQLNYFKQWKFNLKSKVKIRNRLALGESDNFNSSVRRNDLFVGLTNSFNFNFGNIDFNLHQLYQPQAKNKYQILGSSKLLFFIPNKPNYQFYLFAGQKYRQPTLNEYFWEPMGNPNLEAEKGYLFELGFDIVKLKMQKSQHDFQSAFFYSQLDNWIAWIPELDNWGQVVNRGLELSYNLRVPFTNGFFNTQNQYQLIFAELAKSNRPGEIASNEQLRYVPRNQFTLSHSLKWMRLFFNLQTKFQGKRNISNVNNTLISESLHSYLVQNFFIAYKHPLKKNAIEIAFQLNNLFSTNYELIKWHPMPRRNFQIRLKWIWNSGEKLFLNLNT